jgi:hypothetical protein
MWMIEATNKDGTEIFGPYTERGSRVVHGRLSNSLKYYMVRSYSVDAQREQAAADARIIAWAQAREDGIGEGQIF